MKIQSIHANTNFKGLFTDKSKENSGNWKMEYQPYSWEKNHNYAISRMANKQSFDIYDSKLPDNEEIYLRNTTYRAETSKDILGTESYFVNYDGTMRRTIDEKPAMNREKSLEVLYKKYNAFLEMKNEKKGLSVEKVVDVILKADKAKNPKLSYTVGKDAKFAEFISRLPQGLVNNLIKLGLSFRMKKN